MKKVHFTLSDGDSVAVDFETSYTMDEGYVYFEFDGASYKIKLEDGFEFRRSADGNEFVLNGDSTAYVKISEVDKSFDIKVENFEYSNDGNKYVIKYVLESDAGNPKNININFIN